MEKDTYVISILRVKDSFGNDCEPYWEYASYDRYVGSVSSGFPCFSSELGHAERYSSVKEAEEKFIDWWKWFTYSRKNYQRYYDLESLGIRKMVFNTKKKLTVV